MLQLVQSRQHISHGKKNLNKQKESNIKKKFLFACPKILCLKKLWIGGLEVK